MKNIIAVIALFAALNLRAADITNLPGTISGAPASIPKEVSEAFPVDTRSPHDLVINDNSFKLLSQGRHIFRFDTFGDEDFWGGALKLHLAVAGTNNGGVGPGLSPKMALGVGLKVDAEALPTDLVAQINAGQVNLDDPATTLALLQLNAVVGVTGF